MKFIISDVISILSLLAFNYVILTWGIIGYSMLGN